MSIAQTILGLMQGLDIIELRIKEIEKMDKSGLTLDEQENLINEYTKLWNKANSLRKPW